MYDYLIGKVVSISDKYIILEVNNTGYKIYISNNTCLKLNYFSKIYIFSYQTENNTLFYGFIKRIEREVFIKLLDIKKIGVKSAFMILSKYTYEELISIASSSNEEAILSIPKINKDNYKIFIDKLSHINYENVLSINTEFLSILRSLEYPDSMIFKIYKDIDKNKDINEQIKDAIRLLEELNNE